MSPRTLDTAIDCDPFTLFTPPRPLPFGDELSSAQNSGFRSFCVDHGCLPHSGIDSQTESVVEAEGVRGRCHPCAETAGVGPQADLAGADLPASQGSRAAAVAGRLLRASASFRDREGRAPHASVSVALSGGSICSVAQGIQ